MKAYAVVPGSGRYQIVDHPEPQITGRRGVKLKTREIGICGTDLSVKNTNSYGCRPAGFDYLVGFHEGVGEIIELGPEAAPFFKIGDFAVPSVRRPNDGSEEHAAPPDDLDRAAPGTFVEKGISGDHGLGAELVVTGVDYLTKVPGALLDPFIGSFIEPASICVKALEEIADRSHGRRFHFRKKNRVAIIGAGMIGQLLAAMCRLSDASEVVVYAKSPRENNRKAQSLEKIGVEYRQIPPLSDIDWRKLAPEAERFDAIIEACGNGTVIPFCATMLKRDGVLCLTGIPEKAVGTNVRPLDWDEMMLSFVLNHYTLCGIVNSSAPHFQRGALLLEEIAGKFSGWLPQLQTKVIAPWDVETVNHVLDHELGQLKITLKF